MNKNKIKKYNVLALAFVILLLIWLGQLFYFKTKVDVDYDNNYQTNLTLGENNFVNKMIYTKGENVEAEFLFKEKNVNPNEFVDYSNRSIEVTDRFYYQVSLQNEAVVEEGLGSSVDLNVSRNVVGGDYIKNGNNILFAKNILEDEEYKYIVIDLYDPKYTKQNIKEETQIATTIQFPLDKLMEEVDVSNVETTIAGIKNDPEIYASWLYENEFNPKLIESFDVKFNIENEILIDKINNLSKDNVIEVISYLITLNSKTKQNFNESYNITSPNSGNIIKIINTKYPKVDVVNLKIYLDYISSLETEVNEILEGSLEFYEEWISKYTKENNYDVVKDKLSLKEKIQYLYKLYYDNK